jgi:elongation factor G
VISLSITPPDHAVEDKLAKALRRFCKEDPTFRSRVDPESNETIISGMGELHLEIYLERMRREYGVNVCTSAPKVSYREAITKRTSFDYIHKKQTGGAGQYARVAGYVEPCDEGFEFVDETKGGVIPRQYMPAIESGFREMMKEGGLIHAPVIGVRVVVNDGKFHAVDSSELAFKTAAEHAWRQLYPQAAPKILEPVMRVTVESPKEFGGSVVATLVQRRGMILGSHESRLVVSVEAEVPLSEMMGYATTLRSSTQGKAEFTMEFSRYLEAPLTIAQTLIENAQRERGPQRGKKRPTTPPGGQRLFGQAQA